MVDFLKSGHILMQPVYWDQNIIAQIFTHKLSCGRKMQMASLCLLATNTSSRKTN